MGNFFTTPREQAARSMYDMAISGKSPWQDLISQEATLAKQNISRDVSSAKEQATTDIMSRAASAGHTWSGGTEDLIGRQVSSLAEGGEKAKTQVDVQAMQENLGSLISLLNTGFSGLKNTTLAGDVLGGLQTLSSLGVGIGMMGGMQGLNWWGGNSDTGPSTDWLTPKESDLSSWTPLRMNK